MNALIKELKLHYTGDAWGWVMCCRFAIAGEMFSRGLDIPSHWEYWPGACGDGRDPDALERVRYLQRVRVSYLLPLNHYR